MKPSLLLLIILAEWGILGVAASFWPALVPVWGAVGLLIGLLSLLDIVLLVTRPPVEVERRSPGRFALGVEQTVDLVLRNPGRWPARVQVHDGIPPAGETAAFPWWGSVPGRGNRTVTYPLKFLRRGRMEFAPVHLMRVSPLRFWLWRSRQGTAETVRVFPNYEPVLRYALLALAHQEDQMGIIQRHRRGVSREFHQLRDYQDGDVLSQIDWKATSRRLELISREYREQRDQNIVFLLDAGRRMRAMDGELPQFDHCLNAVLFLCYVALRQGDHVGVLGYGGAERWLPPVKGPRAMTALLQHLYDYETTTHPSDFSEAAQDFMARQRRRALVVLLTNLRSEDTSDLLPAIQTLQRHHVVILGTLREQSVDECRIAPVQDFDGALRYTATQLYLEQREDLLNELRAKGVITVDEVARNLPAGLANAYLEVKNSGRL